MGSFRSGKLRWLYLLALAQLVGGPLVLLQFALFCKVTLNETPRVGIARAAVFAWQAESFHDALAIADHYATHRDGTSPRPADPRQPLEKSKSPIAPWETSEIDFAVLSCLCEIADRARPWTPIWPQAPPGPPPRAS
jgi:hypothetical protein